MREAYTSQELAAILAMTRQGIEYRAASEGWQHRKRAGRGGGKEWLVASMPRGTRLAIQTEEARRAVEQEKALAPTPLPAPLAYAHPDYNKMILEDKRRNGALAKADLLRQYIGWQEKFGFKVAQKEAFILAYKGGTWPKLLAEVGPELSWKTLELWKRLQTRAGTVMALADKRGIAHKGKTHLTERHVGIILGQFLNPNRPQIAQCHRLIDARCKAEGLWSPSEPTIRRFIHAFMSECYSEFIMWREGDKALNDKCLISIIRDWSLVGVGDIVFADGHTLNFETLDPETGKPKRMTLLLFYDGASNYPLGWEIMPTESTACISSAFRRACIALGKFPRIIYIDNGKAFRAKFFKGCADFEQAGISGLYESLGCKVIHAMPYHGQSKTIERFFGTFHDLEVRIPSYTGNSIDNKPARMMRGEVLHRSLYEKMGGRPLTLEETHFAVGKWFAEYALRPQYRTHLAGRTPSEVFEAGRGPGVDLERLTLMMLHKEIKVITKDGIKHRGRWYWHEALANRRHPVVIYFDDVNTPWDVLVYTQDGQPLCEARERGHYGIASGIHPAAHHLGTAEQRLALSEAIELRKGLAKDAGANLTAMRDKIVLPEARRMQEALALPAAPTAKVTPFTPKPMSAEEVAAHEAAVEKALEKYEREADPAYYEPAHSMRFKSEQNKYEYCFLIKYEKGLELVPQDEAYMQAFEASEQYERYYKNRYTGLKEYFDSVRSA